MPKQKPVIAVIGGRTVSKNALIQAERVGELIARLGAVLISGGCSGIMEAASKGASDNNGIVVGILPGNERSEANPYVQIPITTGIGIARNSIIARSADLLIAIEGSYGTLSEIAYALQMGKKVYTLNSWTLPEKGPHPNLIIVQDLSELEKELMSKFDC